MTHIEYCLIPCLFQTITEKHASSAVIPITNLFQSSVCCPSAPPEHLFFLSLDLISQTKFILVEKVPIFFVYKAFVDFFSSIKGDC